MIPFAEMPILLKLLKAEGVSKFKGFGVEVEFVTQASSTSTEIVPDPRATPVVPPPTYKAPSELERPSKNLGLTASEQIALFNEIIDSELSDGPQDPD